MSEEKKVKYLVKYGNHNFKSLWKVDKETEKSYLVGTTRIPKSTMKTNRGSYECTNWKVATDEDITYFNRLKLIDTIQSIVARSDFENYTTEELEANLKILKEKAGK